MDIFYHKHLFFIHGIHKTIITVHVNKSEELYSIDIHLIIFYEHFSCIWAKKSYNSFCVLGKDGSTL